MPDWSKTKHATVKNPAAQPVVGLDVRRNLVSFGLAFVINVFHVDRIGRIDAMRRLGFGEYTVVIVRHGGSSLFLVVTAPGGASDTVKVLAEETADRDIVETRIGERID